MGAIIDFVFFVLGAILNLIVLTIFVYVILSWLVAFNVVNMRNRVVYSIVNGVDAVMRPILRPVRRILPNLGGLDLSPFIVMIVIQGVLIYLLPALQNELHALVGS
jgi:YggT family protein